MIGLPGSGKSTVAREKIIPKLNKGCIFSSDEYRRRLLGDECDQSNNQLVFSTLYRELLQCLKMGRDAILDATNICIKDRKRIFDQIKSIRNDVEVIAYLVNTPLSTCIERDKMRDRIVGKGVIFKMLDRFQCPQYFEGFDKIEFDFFQRIHNTFDGAILPILNIMDDFDQENPHHVGTLGEHCRKLASYYEDEGSLQYLAGLLHDVGKLSSKSVDEQHICHYYNHDNRGAYNICCFPEYLNFKFDFNDCLTIIAIINFHMKFHKDWLNNEKYKKLLGNTLYDILAEFAEYDKLASGTTEIHNYIMDAMKVKKLALNEIRSSSEYKKAKERFEV